MYRPFLLFIGTICFQLASAQQLDFLNYNREQGLSHSQLNAVFSDSRGFIWMGTWDGLVRYDGHEFIRYGTEEGLPGKRIYCISEDMSGNLWVGLDEGLSKFDGKTFSNFSTEHGLSVLPLEKMYMSKDSSTLWLYGFGLGHCQGIASVDLTVETNEITTYTMEDGLLHNNVQYVSEDYNNNLIIGTHFSPDQKRGRPDTGGISILIDGNFVNYTSSNGLPHSSINFVEGAENGDIWACTSGGIALKKKNQKNFKAIQAEEILGFPRPEWKNLGFVVFKDSKGTLWFCAQIQGKHKGVVIISKGQHQNVRRYFVNDIQSTPRLMKEDKMNRLWFEHQFGIFLIDESANYEREYIGDIPFFKIQNIGKEQGMLGAPYASSFSFDREGNFWIAHDGDGVSKFSHNGFSSYNEKSGIMNKHVWGFLEDSKGVFWITTMDGVYTLKDGVVSKFIAGDQFMYQGVYSIYEDKEGIYWFGHGNGAVSTYRNGEVKSFLPALNVPFSQGGGFWDFLEDDEGDLWMGTLQEGILIFDGENWSQIYGLFGKDSLELSGCFKIEKGEKKDLWLACSNLLGLWDGDQIHVIDAKKLKGGRATGVCYDKGRDILWTFGSSGISSVKISNRNPYEFEIRHWESRADIRINSGINVLQIDKNGDLWSGHQNGLDKLDLNEKGEIVRSRLFGKYEGFRPIESNMNSSMLDSKGRLWFGSIDGAVCVDTDELKRKQPPPMVHVTSLHPEFSNASWDSLGFSDQDFFGLPDNLVLDYNQNKLSFDYTAINYTAPKRIRYQYRLLRNEDEVGWSRQTKSRHIAFTNLIHGDYEFQLKAVNGDQVWSEIYTYKFTITPPFWKTTWFYTICVVIGIGLIYLLIKARERKLQIDKKRLEHKVQIRTEELKDAMEEIAEKNEDIVGSIQYASRIQNAILPTEEYMSETLKDYFVWYQPKDIIAGDFYWVENKDDNAYFSAADCTGHGVPGAMVSVMCSNALTKALLEMNIEEPSKILDATVELLENRFAKGDKNLKDGMDLGLCLLNRKKMTLEYSGANNPLYIVRAGELIEHKADKQPVGAYEHRKPFENHKIELAVGDVIYLSSDGFPDQFGGEKGKKYKYKPFKRFLINISEKPMSKQHGMLKAEFESWRGGIEQVDDVCIIGVRV